MKNSLKKSVIPGRKIIVDILAILFGVSSWLVINGMFVQLPLLVTTAPESWNLPSYMSIAVQIANLGPILYAVYRKFYPNGNGDKYWVVVMLSLSATTVLLMAFFYNKLTVINGHERSLAFLILVFCAAVPACTSSVLYFPYMRHFKEMYIISYFIGEGLSGFIPSILALIQGIGGNPECIEDSQSGNVTLIYKDPRYSTQVFFLITSFIGYISLCAFLLLINLEICKSEKISSSLTTNDDDNDKKYKLENMKSKNDYYEDIDKQSDTISQCQSVNIIPALSPTKSANLLLLMAVVCAFGNGVFPSIQSYSCLPYGNLAYHLSVTLGSMSNPIACFLALFLPRTSNRAISILTIVCSIFIGYILATSILSPSPPMVNLTAGIVFIIITWIGAVGLVSYIKLCVSTIFRSQGGSWMFYCGAASQLGSAVGSLISFVLVNYTNIFVPSNPCG